MTYNEYLLNNALKVESIDEFKEMSIYDAKNIVSCFLASTDSTLPYEPSLSLSQEQKQLIIEKLRVAYAVKMICCDQVAVPNASVGISLNLGDFTLNNPELQIQRDLYAASWSSFIINKFENPYMIGVCELGIKCLLTSKNYDLLHILFHEFGHMRQDVYNTFKASKHKKDKHFQTLLRKTAGTPLFDTVWAAADFEKDADKFSHRMCLKALTAAAREGLVNGHIFKNGLRHVKRTAKDNYRHAYATLSYPTLEKLYFGKQKDIPEKNMD